MPRDDPPRAPCMASDGVFSEQFNLLPHGRSLASLVRANFSTSPFMRLTRRSQRRRQQYHPFSRPGSPRVNFQPSFIQTAEAEPMRLREHSSIAGTQLDAHRPRHIRVACRPRGARAPVRCVGFFQPCGRDAPRRERRGNLRRAPPLKQKRVFHLCQKN